MSVNLHIAPAAAGKTAYAVGRARAAAQVLGDAVYVCVANRLQRRSWQQRLADAGGAIGVHVVTFAQLYRRYLQLAGVVVIELDEPVQHRLWRTAVRRAELVHYAPLRDKPGFPVLLSALVAELKAALLGPEDLAKGVAALGDEPRLRELAQLYSRYQGQLDEHAWADGEELGWATLRALEQNPAVGRSCALLVLDGFDTLTTVQLQIVALLAGRARETLITLTGEPGAPERRVQRRFQDTRQRLEAALGVTAQPLPVFGGQRADQLDQLERGLFERLDDAPAQDGPEDAGAVALIEAADRAGEVRAALRWLKDQIVRRGCHPGEVALLARNVAPYRRVILQVAAEFGIPVRLLDGQPLGQVPIIAALLNLVRLWEPLAPGDPGPALPWRLVVESWRSPYFCWEHVGLEAGDAERLDAAARRGNVIGGLRHWREALARHESGGPADLYEEGDSSGPAEEQREDLLGLSDKFERFVDLLTPPSDAHTVRGLVGWLETLIGDDGSGDAPDERSLRVVESARATGSTAEWDLAALRAFKDVLRGLVWASDTLGYAPTGGLAELLRELQSAVEATICYLPEVDAEDRLLVADVVQARGVPFRAVAVMGLAEGEFPATLHEDPLLRDADRAGLRRLGHPLEPSTLSAELGYFYEAVARPRERLLLTRPRLAENGATWEASPYWEEVCRLTGVQPHKLTSEEPIGLAEAASWPELLEGLAQIPMASPWRAWAQRQRPERLTAWQQAVSVLRARSQRSTSVYQGDLGACSEQLLARYGPQYRWSASALESYRDCPHRFFVERVLGLQARVDPAEELDAAQLGTIYHRLLERVYAGCAEHERTSAHRLLAELDRVAGAILDAAPGREGFRANAWWDQTRAEIVDNVRRTLEALTAVGGDAIPVLLEWRFECEVPANNPVEGPLRLRGIVDRLDVSSDDEWCVVDYKTGGPSDYGPKSLDEGRKLQLPLYALAASLGLQARVTDGFYWHVRSAEPSGLRLSSFGVETAIEAALRYARDAVRGVQTGRFAPRAPASGCRDYCPAVAFCPRFRPGFGW